MLLTQLETNMKTEIEDWQLMLIRQCKRNKPNIRIMQRIYGYGKALRVEHVPIQYVIHGLIEIIEYFELRGGTLMEFIYDLDPARDKWFGFPERSFQQTVLDKCMTIIRQSQPAKDFPRYPSPAWFRNNHNKRNNDMNTNWKPIETAPKDGTYILAKCKGSLALSGKTFIPAVVAFKDGSWQEAEIPPNDNKIWVLDLWMELPPSDNGQEYCNISDN